MSRSDPAPPGATFQAKLHDDLDALTSRHRRRALAARAGHDFASNDYLGLAGSPDMRAIVADALTRGVPIGAGGSRLLRGNHEEHEALEAEAARWFGSEAALYFSTGFAANGGLFAALPGTDDLVVHDELIHASVHDGMRLGRAARVSARHNDADAVADAIAQWRREGGTGRPWIAVESLYSMDGDRAPLADLVAIADREDAVLIVDEAHATGVFGPGGRGLAAKWEGRDNLITLRTCGKALGAEGALVCASRAVCDILINRARGFIFSTAPSPLMAAAVRGSLALLEREAERIARLDGLVRHAHDRLVPLGALASGSPIMPVIVGDDARTMEIAARLQAQGFDVRGIRPPTVPVGTARLRLSITLNVDAATIDALAEALKEAL
ncbi:8-amino-7-oxononanoate synthase [Sphingomonas mali]|uniref:8-amino-7-oxononanoate synthase n=1 Tax=Sphingomonas mali TaxID=40682 RepID=UPI00082B9B32|nr:8-amino-7-oxononanoate synthase [Sphingomonas mali]